jgi:hypothetical protein
MLKTNPFEYKNRLLVTNIRGGSKYKKYWDEKMFLANNAIDKIKKIEKYKGEFIYNREIVLIKANRTMKIQNEIDFDFSKGYIGYRIINNIERRIWKYNGSEYIIYEGFSSMIYDIVRQLCNIERGEMKPMEKDECIKNAFRIIINYRKSQMSPVQKELYEYTFKMGAIASLIAHKVFGHVVSGKCNPVKYTEDAMDKDTYYQAAGIRWVSSIERYLHISAAEEQEVLKMYHPLG